MSAKRRAPNAFCRATAVSVLLACAVFAGQHLSHPPARPLPEPSARQLADGPGPVELPVARGIAVEGGRALFVDAARGDDGADGTEEGPWRTLGHSLAQLRPGDTLCLRGGVYYERLSINVMGVPDKPVTIRSYPGELAVIDGGYREFFESPQTSWEPVAGGQPDEFRSTRAYPELAEDPGVVPWHDGHVGHPRLPLGPLPEPGREAELGVPRGILGSGYFSRTVKVLGNFGDSMVPLHGYYNFADLPADHPQVARRRGEGEHPPYFGPGVWYDMRTGRIHVRLSHTEIEGLEPLGANYRGATDPRNLPLVIGGPRVAVHVENSQHLRFKDLVLRGSRSRTLNIESSSDIELDGVTVYGGAPALHIERTARFRMVHSALRGLTAPWASRASEKYHGIACYLLIADSLPPQNTDFEIAYSEFTDNHDGLIIGTVNNLVFRNNYVHNFPDDGLYLSLGMPPGDDVRIYKNYIGRTLMALAFAGPEIYGGRGEVESGRTAYIFRNVFDMREPTNRGGEQMGVHGAEGRVQGDHGSPDWKPMMFYHNTVALPGATWRGHYGGGLGQRGVAAVHRGLVRREIRNNIFFHAEGMPGMQFFYGAGADWPENTRLVADGNLHWSFAEGPDYEGDFLAEGRRQQRRQPHWFELSKGVYEPGWTANDVFADPQFVRFTPDWNVPLDLRLAEGSPAAGAGIEIPEEWPDPLRGLEEGGPDIGALPLGGDVWRVGVRGRFTAFGEPLP